MENVTEVLARVEKDLPGKLIRWDKFLKTLCIDPRAARGQRHKFAHCVMALLAGVVCDRKSLREVETLSQWMGLGSRGRGVSDGALSHLLGLCRPEHFDALLVASVKEMFRRGELRPADLSQGWVAIDGKYSCLDHHCGGWGQKFLTPDAKNVHWRVGVLRAVLITAPARPALGQFAMGPVATPETDPEKIKHTGEITNLPNFIGKLRPMSGSLIRNFTLDAGLWSKPLFSAMDTAGFGLLCALKDNKPELHAEVARLLRIDMARLAPQAQSDWERGPHGNLVRRRLWRTTRLDGWLGWKNLRQAVVLEQTTRDKDGNDTVELRYFVTNGTTGMLSPAKLLQLIRGHWAIENDCNWTFDTQFGEDDRRWCTENMAILALGALRMAAYNLLQRMRRCHVRAKHPRAPDAARPWRSTAEFAHGCIKRVGRQLVAQFGEFPQRTARPIAAALDG